MTVIAPPWSLKRETIQSEVCGVRRSPPVPWTDFSTHDDGPLLAGRRAGRGPRVLLLHGGPGIGFDYLRDLADELAQENDVAWYQQRGLEPSAVAGPYSVGADVADARRVLDALGWEQATVVGHSWGGHLALHVAAAMPERLRGVLAVDPLGAVGDGCWPALDEEIFRRTPEATRARARELDEIRSAGTADEELALEGMRLVWAAYFADPDRAPPMPTFRYSSERSAQVGRSIQAELPALEEALGGIRVPVGFVHGSRSPMPLAASTDAADRIPGAWVEVVEGAGHFVWVEAPGTVRAALRRLTEG
jgi:pimeloyl-ACP methyl ester carboxylesterase